MRPPALPRRSSLRTRNHPDDPQSEPLTLENVEKLEKLCRLCRKERRGAAAVEFAIVAPIFFLLIFGMIEFGRAVMVQQIITNASREGARIAVLDGTTHSDVDTAVSNYLQRANLTAPGTVITITVNDIPIAGDPCTASVKPTDHVGVAVQIPFSQVTWLPSPIFLGGGATLTGTTVMRRETVDDGK
jgi:Flp pilus assembly protein TadG